MQPLPAMDTASVLRLAPNVGRTDRVVRAVAGLLLLVLVLFVLDGTWAMLAGLVGVIAVGTAFFSFCPLYRLLGVRTTPDP